MFTLHVFIKKIDTMTCQLPKLFTSKMTSIAFVDMNFTYALYLSTVYHT